MEIRKELGTEGLGKKSGGEGTYEGSERGKVKWKWGIELGGGR